MCIYNKNFTNVLWLQECLQEWAIAMESNYHWVPGPNQHQSLVNIVLNYEWPLRQCILSWIGTDIWDRSDWLCTSQRDKWDKFMMKRTVRKHFCSWHHWTTIRVALTLNSKVTMVSTQIHTRVYGRIPRTLRPSYVGLQDFLINCFELWYWHTRPSCSFLPSLIFNVDYSHSAVFCYWPRKEKSPLSCYSFVVLIFTYSFQIVCPRCFENGIEYQCFSRYCIKVWNSSYVTTLDTHANTLQTVHHLGNMLTCVLTWG